MVGPVLDAPSLLILYPSSVIDKDTGTRVVVARSGLNLLLPVVDLVRPLNQMETPDQCHGLESMDYVGSRLMAYEPDKCGYNRSIHHLNLPLRGCIARPVDSGAALKFVISSWYCKDAGW